MTISTRVKGELFENQDRLIRLEQHLPAGERTSTAGPTWTEEEHERFLQALELFPSGPWKAVANHVGTKTPRQTMTHAQKYRQKIARRKRGLKITIHDKAGRPVTSPWLTQEAQTEDAMTVEFGSGLQLDITQDAISPEEHAAMAHFFMDGCVIDDNDLLFEELLEDYEPLFLDGDN